MTVYYIGCKIKVMKELILRYKSIKYSIDRNPLNNLPDNLRIVSAAQNAWNSSSKGDYPKGITRIGDYYTARISKNGIHYQIRKLKMKKRL